MKKIIFILFLLLSYSANAKEIKVTAVGYGENYDWAIMNAVENAVRQTSDIEIEGNGLNKVDIESTFSEDMAISGKQGGNLELNVAEQEKELISTKEKDGNLKYNEKFDFDISGTNKATMALKDNSKQILAKYKGKVSSYSIIEQSEKDGKYMVKIEAIVEKFDSKDYKSKGLKKKAEYSLAVLPFKAKGNFSCMGKNISLDEFNSSINNLFIEKLAPSGKFNLVDRDNFDSYAKEINLVVDDLTQKDNRERLHNIVPADYILVGTIDNYTVTTKEKHIELTGETDYSSSSKVKISYRILESATMEIITAGSVEKKFKKNGKFSSCRNVENLLLEKAITEASDKLLKDIFDDYKAPIKKETKSSQNSKKRKESKAKAVDYSLPLY